MVFFRRCIIFSIFYAKNWLKGPISQSQVKRSRKMSREFAPERGHRWRQGGSRGGYDTFLFNMNASKGEWIEGVNEKNQRLRSWVLE